MNRAVSASVENYVLQEWEFDAESDSDTSAVARMIAVWALPGNWLDLGCGPMLTVWPMFHNGPVEIYGLDRNIGIAAFHQRLRFGLTADLPPGLSAATAYALSFRAQHGMTYISSLPIDGVKAVATADVLTRVAEWSGLFDTVIQIGCFGCLNSLGDLHQALAIVRDYLKPGCVFISATWTPRPTYTESVVWGGDSLRSLDVETFIDALHSVGLEVVAAESSELDNLNYKERFVIAARKPPLVSAA